MKECWVTIHFKCCTFSAHFTPCVPATSVSMPMISCGSTNGRWNRTEALLVSPRPCRRRQGPRPGWDSPKKMSVVAEAGEGHFPITCLTWKNVWDAERTTPWFLLVNCKQTKQHAVLLSIQAAKCHAILVQHPPWAPEQEILRSKTSCESGTKQSIWKPIDCHETENLLRRTQAKSCG